MFKHEIQGYRGTTVTENLNNQWQIKYQIVSDKYTKNTINKLIPAYCKKELPEYANIQELIIYQDIDNLHTLTIQSLNGLQAINERLMHFMHNLDIFLHYMLMDLASLGEHLEIFHAAVREQHQWHWLREDPNYENLLCQG